jgi:hypothetical protein
VIPPDGSRVHRIIVLVAPAPVAEHRTKEVTVALVLLALAAIMAVVDVLPVMGSEVLLSGTLVILGQLARFGRAELAS